jgi:YVTN family beta-propeller protein
MQTARRTLLFILAFSFVTWLSAVAQTVIATVPVGGAFPWALAVNPVTNEIYVAIANNNLTTVIDGKTLSTTDVTVGLNPAAIALNPITNKIYVSSGAEDTVTVIDGATLSTSSIPVARYPNFIAVNSRTNKIYVAGSFSVTVIDGATDATNSVPLNDIALALDVDSSTDKIYVAVGDGTVAIIDGATLSTSTIPLEACSLAVNPITNKIYTTNFNDGTMTVVDGTTFATTTIPVGRNPCPVAVNPVTNRIDVANLTDSTVSVIDGVTLSTATVPVGQGPDVIAIDSVTDKIYVGNTNDNSVTMIDGTSDSTTTVAVGHLPEHLAVNEVTNRIYVSNFTDGTVSVIAGASSAPQQFVSVLPCRLLDTRPNKGGSGPIPGGTSVAFNLPQLAQTASPPCASLASAAAYSLNVSVVPQGPLGYLTIWPTGEDQPVVATLNSLDGRIKADAAIVPAGYQGAISIYVTQTTNVVLDINGYFAPVSTSTLAFYPLPPCRIADTRKDNFPIGLGSPFLTGLQERDFPILNAASCNIPSTAAAYSLNFSVVPHSALGYMTVWPTGQTRPTVSTLNDIPGTIIANAAIVPAGTGGDVSVYPSNDTDVIIDINGYFDTPGTGGLSLYPAAPCRVIDTRKVGGGQPFSGTLSPPVDVVDSQCGPPMAARAYVFNATVVPYGALGYLTLWPNDGSGQPVVSTLNALDGSISSNMAIVPTSSNGSVNAYASGITQLILDISSYFAP